LVQARRAGVSVEDDSDEVPPVRLQLDPRAQLVDGTGTVTNADDDIAIGTDE